MIPLVSKVLLIKKKQALVLKFILHYVEPNVLTDLCRLKASFLSVKSLWLSIEARYGLNSITMKESIRSEFDNLVLQSYEPKDIDGYLVAFETKMVAARMYHVFTSDKEPLMLLRNGLDKVNKLNDFWKNYGHISSVDDKIACIRVYLQEEALASVKRRFKLTSELLCHICKKPGHKAYDCKNKSHKAPGRINLIKSVKVVSVTKGELLTDGSSRKSIWRTLMLRAQIPLKGPNDVSYKNTWYIDSGAAMSICAHRHMFYHYQPLARTAIATACGKEIVVSGKGNIKLQIEYDGQLDTITFFDVLHLPQAKWNLISIGTLKGAGLTKVTFEDDNKVTARWNKQSYQKVIIGEFDASERLYTLDFKSPSTTTISAHNVNQSAHKGHQTIIATNAVATTRSTVETISLLELHKRLNHMNKQTLLTLYKENRLPNVVLSNDEWTECEACMKCKGGRKAIAKFSTTQYDKPGYIVGDLLDTTVRDLGNRRYVSVFIDIYTRYVSVELLKTKDAKLTFSHFKRFCSFIQTQTGHTVIQLMTDNGKEYDNNLFKALCNDNGIKQCFTPAFTPEFNGIAERNNRTMLENLRTILFESKLDHSFWGELIMGVVHTQNRLPHSKLNNLSPYEKLFGKPPTLNYLKPLGTRAYVQRTSSIDKLQPKFDDCVIVGYSWDSNEYRVYNMRRHEFETSRNVRFSALPYDFPAELLQTDNDQHIPFATLTDELSGDSEDESDVTIPILSAKVHDPDFPTLHEVTTGFDKLEWQASMNAELNNLLQNNVLDTVLDEGQRCLQVIPIFRIKRDEFGNVKQRKTRYVVQGFRQIEGVDYSDTYAPVGNYNTLLLLLHYIATHDYFADQVDFDAAFLNAPLTENIYIRKLPGLEPPPSGKIYKFQKALYGLQG
jgi:hypothetical protein